MTCPFCKQTPSPCNVISGKGKSCFNRFHTPRKAPTRPLCCVVELAEFFGPQGAISLFAPRVLFLFLEGC